MSTKWTDNEIQFLKTNYQIMSAKEIGRILNKTYRSVTSQCEKYGLTKDMGLSIQLKKSQQKEFAIELGKQIVGNFKPLKLFEKPIKTTKVKNLKEEHSILDLSDVHVGMLNEIYSSKLKKKITTYNEKLFIKELLSLKQSIFTIYDILANSYKLNELTINIMGDIITNDRIFPEQPMEIEYVVGQQIWKAIPIFIEFFNSLLAKYKKINVVCVVGNHGRSNPHFYNEPVENNFEYFIYRTWQEHFKKSKRVNVIVPNTRQYLYNIYDWRHLVEHGDSFRGASATSLEKQIEQLYVNTGGFDVFHMGHVHKCKEVEITDKVICKINGSWIPKDAWAFKTFKTYSLPKQHFFGCNEHRPETWSYKLDLRG